MDSRIIVETSSGTLDESYKDAGTPCGNTKCSWNDKKWEANCGAESPDGDPYIAICMKYKREK